MVSKLGRIIQCFRSSIVCRVISLCAAIGGDINLVSRDTTNFFTVEDVVEKLGFGWYQLGITLFSGSLWVSVIYMFSY